MSVGCQASEPQGGQPPSPLVSPPRLERTELLIDGHDAHCRAVIVNNSYALTAQHCVSDLSAARVLELRVRRCSPAGACDVSEADRIWVPCGRSPRSGIRGADIALVHLTRPFSGGRVRHQGLRLDETLFWSGDRAMVPYRPQRLVSGELIGPPATCAGDSGGALVDGQGQLVAIASYASRPCGRGSSVFTLLEPWRASLSAAMSGGSPAALCRLEQASGNSDRIEDRTR